MRKQRGLLIVGAITAMMSLAACGGSGGKDAAATTTTVTATVTRPASADTSSNQPPTTTSTTTSTTTGSPSSNVASSPDTLEPWDPNTSGCELLDPIAPTVLEAKIAPNTPAFINDTCTEVEETSAAGATPRQIRLGTAQGTIADQIQGLTAGIEGVTATSAAGPAPGAKWVILPGDPPLVSLYWTGRDNQTWVMTVIATNPASYKARMLTAAHQVYGRVIAQ